MTAAVTKLALGAQKKGKQARKAHLPKRGSHTQPHSTPDTQKPPEHPHTPKPDEPKPNKFRPDGEAKAAPPGPRLGYTPDGRLKWGPSGGKEALQALKEHWEKHRHEFPHLKSMEEYAEAAYNFVTNPQGIWKDLSVRVRKLFIAIRNQRYLRLKTQMACRQRFIYRPMEVNILKAKEGATEERGENNDAEFI